MGFACFFHIWKSVQSEQIKDFLYKIMKPYFLKTANVLSPRAVIIDCIISAYLQF